MTTDVHDAAGVTTAGSRLAARRALWRWARRLLRREWRQQVLIVAMVAIAVAGLVVGSGIAANSPSPIQQGFGNATRLVNVVGTAPQIANDLATVSRVATDEQVIESLNAHVPGTLLDYSIETQNPSGRLGRPLLQLVRGSLPRRFGEVDLTATLASSLHLSIGAEWSAAGLRARVVGIVENPTLLTDQFALLRPGSLRGVRSATILFNGSANKAATLPWPVLVRQPSAATQAAGTILIAAGVLGLMLVGLVAVAGFTVVAQRRLRSLGMLASLGATDRQLRSVVVANGVVSGASGAGLGVVLGLAVWLGYRPSFQVSVSHVIAPWHVPWNWIVAAAVAGVAVTTIAAIRPARAMARVSVIASLSGRPPSPAPVHRSLAVAVGSLVVGLIILGGASGDTSHGGGQPLVILGLLFLVFTLVFSAPVFMASLGRLKGRLPVSLRIALRDLARYRSRSGSAMAAIALAVLVAMMVSFLTADRYNSVLDYVGPNMAPNQLIVTTDLPNGPGSQCVGGCPHTSPPSIAAQHRIAERIATAVGATDVITLLQTTAELNHAASGRNYTGPFYVATPALLRAYGITTRQYPRHALVLTSRPGLAGYSLMQLIYGNGNAKEPPSNSAYPCPIGACVANPLIAEVGRLPTGTSAPNTVLTEYALHHLHLTNTVSTAGWLLQSRHPYTASQLALAVAIAAPTAVAVQTRTTLPTLDAVLTWASIVAALLALAIVAMAVGLIRAETAGDRRTLSATGAASWTRRSVTAATAGSLALCGSVLGTLVAYLACFAFLQSDEEGVAVLTSPHSLPWSILLTVVVGVPAAAAVGGWILAGREPRMIARRPLD